MPIRFSFNRTKINLFLDILLTIAFVVEIEYRFTGLRIHELLGLAFGLVMLIHLILHLDWVWSITKTFFRLLIHESRLNYVLNLILFVDAVIMVVSGILISRTLNLQIHVRSIGGFSLGRLHSLSAELSLFIIALHVALHWKWIVTNSKKYLFSVKWPLRPAKSAIVSFSSPSVSPVSEVSYETQK